MLEDEGDMIESNDLAAGLADESDEDEDWGGVAGTKSKKRKDDDDGKERRRETGGLPTFVSSDDYAK